MLKYITDYCGTDKNVDGILEQIIQYCNTSYYNINARIDSASAYNEIDAIIASNLKNILLNLFYSILAKLNSKRGTFVPIC